MIRRVPTAFAAALFAYAMHHHAREQRGSECGRDASDHGVFRYEWRGLRLLRPFPRRCMRGTFFASTGCAPPPLSPPADHRMRRIVIALCIPVVASAQCTHPVKQFVTVDTPRAAF